MSAFLHVHASLYWVEAILEDSCRLRRHLFSAAVDGLKYADSHEWAKIDGETATIGISDFAQVFSRPCSHRNNCSHLTSSPIVMSSFTSHFVGFAASDPMLTNQVPSNRSLAWAERIGYLLGFKVNIFNLGSTPIRKLKAVCCNSLQAELGDIVFVELPEVGDEVTQGQSFGVVESVKVDHYLYTTSVLQNPVPCSTGFWMPSRSCTFIALALCPFQMHNTWEAQEYIIEITRHVGNNLSRQRSVCRRPVMWIHRCLGRSQKSTISLETSQQQWVSVCTAHQSSSWSLYLPQMQPCSCYQTSRHRSSLNL